MYKNVLNLKNALSPYNNFCDGYGNLGASGNSYILGLTLGVGVSEKNFSHYGSSILDEINSFDLAEVEDTYIGQLNMSIVSSFCGPQGLIWGYDIARHDELANLSSINALGKVFYNGEKKIQVYDAKYLIDATKTLFGTKDNKRFIIRPGSHVPFAGKNQKIAKESTIYAGIAIGIPKNREVNACLLMEDTGIMSSSWFTTDEQTIIKNLVNSVLSIGENQDIEYEHCFVGIKHCEVGKDQIGCALVAAPYFTIAKNALLKTPNDEIDYSRMFTTTLRDWEREIFKTN